MVKDRLYEKYKKLARHGGMCVWSSLLGRLRQENLLNRSKNTKIINTAYTAMFSLLLPTSQGSLTLVTQTHVLSLVPARQAFLQFLDGNNTQAFLLLKTPLPPLYTQPPFRSQLNHIYPATNTARLTRLNSVHAPPEQLVLQLMWVSRKLQSSPKASQQHKDGETALPEKNWGQSWTLRALDESLTRYYGKGELQTRSQSCLERSGSHISLAVSGAEEQCVSPAHPGGLGNPQTSTSQVAKTTGTLQHAWLIFLCFVETEFCHVAQPDLGHLGSSNPTASASGSVDITGLVIRVRAENRKVNENKEDEL
ncbi:EEF1A lysine methyltransferase 2 [Plecturocebus cupreus]